MAMTAELWEEISQKIMDAEGDQAVITTLLNQARNEFAELLTDYHEKAEQNEKLTGRVDQLLDANREFYLQLGERNKQEKSEEQKKQEEAENITPEALMDDFLKGES